VHQWKKAIRSIEKNNNKQHRNNKESSGSPSESSYKESRSPAESRGDVNLDEKMGESGVGGLPGNRENTSTS